MDRCNEKLRLSADIYTYEAKDLHISKLGQTFALVGSDIPNDLAAAVMADITPYAANVLTGVVTQTYQGLAAQLAPFSVVSSGALLLCWDTNG